MKDLIDIRAEGRAIDKALKSMLAKAKAAGVAKPYIYFESEGSVYVMDNDHPSGGEDQDAVIGKAHISTPHDVGAW